MKQNWHRLLPNLLQFGQGKKGEKGWFEQNILCTSEWNVRLTAEKGSRLWRRHNSIRRTVMRVGEVRLDAKHQQQQITMQTGAARCWQNASKFRMGHCDGGGKRSLRLIGTQLRPILSVLADANAIGEGSIFRTLDQDLLEYTRVERGDSSRFLSPQVLSHCRLKWRVYFVLYNRLHSSAHTR